MGVACSARFSIAAARTILSTRPNSWARGTLLDPKARKFPVGRPVRAGTPVAEHIRTGYTAEDRSVRVMISIIPGDTLILQYTIPT